MANDFKIDKYMFKLLQSEPFFAAISRRVEKIATTSIPTAGVRINPQTANFELFYNPEFFESLTMKQIRGVLKHEFYHLIFQHLTTRMPGGELSKMWNIATDLAINSYLVGELPEGCCVPGQDMFSEFPIGKSSEWYYEKLKQMRDEQKGEGEGKGQNGGGAGQFGDTFDDHSGWGDADEVTSSLAKEKMRQLAQEAAKEANANGWGSVPSDVRKEIAKMTSQVVDWKKVLRYFIKTSERAERKSSIKKINRRYPYIHAGKKRNNRAKIAISIDQSGSVSDAALQKFFAELDNLAQLAEFTVIPFDTRVVEEKIFVWRRGERRQWRRVAFGGTDFNPPTKYVNERGFDGHIILTDMCAPKPIASKCQRLWIVCASRPYFQTNEKVIFLTGNS
jgi:predicted metal-dependent peptidase